MKKLIAALSLVTVLASCGNEQAPADNGTDTNNDNTTATTDNANEVKDPICGMVYDGTWTEYSVAGTDTTWYCSETCKTAYLAKLDAQKADDANGDAHDDHAGHDHDAH